MRPSLSLSDYKALPQSVRDRCTIGAPVSLPLGIKARGRVRHEPGRQNKLELQYEQHLEDEKRAGRIAWFAFEAITLRLANRCTLMIDFVVMLSDGAIEFHETKGHMEDDAAAKLRVAATLFPMFPFYVVRKTRDGWKLKEWK